MILRIIERLIALFTDLSMPASPPMPKPVRDPEGDGRTFAWVRSRGASLTPMQPIILRDPFIGPKLELMDIHLMKPHEYRLTIGELAELYPAPEVKPEP